MCAFLQIRHQGQFRLFVVMHQDSVIKRDAKRIINSLTISKSLFSGINIPQAKVQVLQRYQRAKPHVAVSMTDLNRLKNN